jgi:hypothetical protein
MSIPYPDSFPSLIPDPTKTEEEKNKLEIPSRLIYNKPNHKVSINLTEF